MKPKWLDRTLFVSSHYITLCTTEKLFKKALKHLNIAKNERPEFLSDWNSSATAHFFTNRKDKEASVVVCLGSTEGKTLSQVYALLVHEAVHIWQETKECLGETNPSVELEAYAIQNLSYQLMSEYNRQTEFSAVGVMDNTPGFYPDNEGSIPSLHAKEIETLRRDAERFKAVTRKQIYDMLIESGGEIIESCCSVPDKRCGTDVWRIKTSQVENLLMAEKRQDHPMQFILDAGRLEFLQSNEYELKYLPIYADQPDPTYIVKWVWEVRDKHGSSVAQAHEWLYHAIDAARKGEE